MTDGQQGSVGSGAVGGEHEKGLGAGLAAGRGLGFYSGAVRTAGQCRAWEAHRAGLGEGLGKRVGSEARRVLLFS